MRTTVRRMLLVAVVVLAGVGLWRSAALEGEKRRLAKAHAEAEQMVKELEAERAKLNEELANTQGMIASQAGDLAQVRDELQETQVRLEAVGTRLAMLQREAEELRADNASLGARLGEAALEKQQLEAKLSSLKELRLAIRDVRRKMSQQRWAAWRARWSVARSADRELLASDNQGYVVRNGVPTLGASPRLHVHVLEPQEAAR